MEPLAELLGRSPGIAAVRDQVRQMLRAWSVSRRPPPVLFQGETGTGKGLVAGALHRASPRVSGPFVNINCAALPETLIEAELFGYEAGAFTNARRSKPGLIQLASRGTLFLDEIGLLPRALQAKLLSVLEDRAVRRLGSTHLEPVDLWLIAATNENLTEAVRSGSFREDLYHRLAVITITLPPLRARGDDVLLLGQHFLDKACADYGLPPKSLAPDAGAALRAYPWPGNVRELGNVIERVALLADTTTIGAAHLASIAGAPPPGHRMAPAPRALHAVPSAHDVMRDHLLTVLTETGWNITRTAAALGVSRNTVHARIARYGLRTTSTGAPPPAPSRTDAGAPTRGAVAPATPHWQPRRLTLLHVRVTGPADGELPGAPTLDLIEEKLQGFGGRVEDAGPDGVLAVFGLESTAEPAVVAAHSALVILNAARKGQLPSGTGRPLTIAIALHTAEVMVSLAGGAVELEPDGSRVAWGVVEALLQPTDADTTVVSEPAAAMLRRRFRFAPLGGGRRGYRLEGLWHAAAGGHPDPGALVDRAEELALLEGRLALVAQGTGQVVDLVGDAGIGKSRLILALAERAPLGRVVYLEGRCSPATTSTPFHPLLSILQGACDIGESDPPEIVSQRAAAAAATVGLDTTLASALLDLLMSGPAETPGPDPAIVKRRLFTAIERLLLGRSVASPLLIAVEDLHWIDPSSEECLARLVEAAGSASILLVFTYRVGYRAPWAGRSHVSRLALPPLSNEDSRTVVQAVLETSASDEIVRTILARAEGNPLFLEELSLSAREPGGDRAPTSMPATIEEVISARIGRLRSRPRQLLATAAVIGRDVPLGLLDRVTDFPGEALQETLEQLRRSDFLYRTIRPHTEPSYVFKHTLVQDVAYQATPPAERRRLHDRVVTALERLSTGRSFAEHAERLGDHAYEGELWEKAVLYLEKAGVKAALRSAGREAVARFQRALQALAHLPDTRANLERGIDLRLKLRNPLFLLADFRHALAVLNEVVRLADSIHAPAQAGIACAFMANAHFMLGNLDDGIRLADRARAAGDALEDPLLLAISCCHLGQLRYGRGEYTASVGMMQMCLGHLEAAASRRRSNTVRVYSVVARCFIAFSLAALGRFDEAETSSRRCLDVAQTTETPFLRALAIWSRGNVALARGALAEAAAALVEAYGHCESSELLAIRPWIATDLGRTHALRGHGHEALGLVSAAVRDAASHQLLSQHSLRLAYLAEVQLDTGQELEAKQTATQALELAVARGESGFRVAALRAIARVAARRGGPDLDAAEGYLREALALGQDLGMRPAVAHCHGDLAVVSRRAGRSEEAAGHQRAAEALYRDLDTPGWRERLARDTSS